MSRFQVVIRSQRAGQAPTQRRFALGRLGAAVLAALLTLVAAVGVVVALLLGYLIAGLMVAALLVVLFAALLRAAFR